MFYGKRSRDFLVWILFIFFSLGVTIGLLWCVYMVDMESLNAGSVIEKRNVAVVNQLQDRCGKKMLNLSNTSLDVSNWKIYRNKGYGFGLKYPAKYSFEENVTPTFFQVTFSNIEKPFSRIWFSVTVNRAGFRSSTLDIHLDTRFSHRIKIDNNMANAFFLKNGYCDGPMVCSLPIDAFTVRSNDMDYAIDFYGFHDNLNVVMMSVLDSFIFCKS